MKKYVVSFFVIITFSVYAVYQRMVGVDAAAIVPNPNSFPTTEVTSDGVVISSLPTNTSGNTTAAPPTSPTATVEPKSPAPTPVKIKVAKPAPAPVAPKSTGLYKDGQYTGPSVDAYYGNIQVSVTISGGKITDVQFLDYPQDRRTSISINSRAMPYLRQEAIQAQSANVNTVSGATDSSGAFRQSLASALSQAKNS